MEKKIFIEKLTLAIKHNLKVELDEKQQEQMFLLAERLIEVNKVMNLTAIVDEDGIILRHFVDSLLISRHILPNSRIIDVGCGAGFPSLPLAILRPDISITSLDSTEKRIKYVDETAKILGLTNVTAITARAEELAQDKKYRESFDYATARAVASLPILCELTIPFIRVGGSLVAMKAKNAKEEFDAAKNAISKLAGDESLKNTVLFNSDLVGVVNGENICEGRVIVVTKKMSHTQSKYPRKFSQIKKLPL